MKSLVIEKEDLWGDFRISCQGPQAKTCGVYCSLREFKMEIIPKKKKVVFEKKCSACSTLMRMTFTNEENK
jgi:hypothetical protein